MREYEFRHLQKMQDDSLFYKLEENDNFLYGSKVIDQTNTKKIGDPITYYKVIKKKGNNIEYLMIFDILEKNKKEEN